MPIEEIKTISSFISSLGVTGLLVTLAVPKIKKKLWGENGHDPALMQKLEIIESNHLHTLEEKIENLTAREIEGNEVNKEILFILRDVREELRRKTYGKK